MKFCDAAYRYATAIRHQGLVIAFAARASHSSPATFKIGYSVLTLSPTSPAGVDSWTDFQLLDFPTELRPVGMRLLTLGFGDHGIPTADAPFRVVSDGLHVYVFRQSGQNTLLVDRFVYDAANATLVNTWEVRFRRSQKIDLPEGPRDTFGSTDMTGRHFVEPTTELTMVDNLTGGWFDVLILPTNVTGMNRWQIFAYDTVSQTLDSFSILRASDGLFDLSDVIDPSGNVLLPTAQFSIVSGEPSVPVTIATGPAALLYVRQEQVADEQGQPYLFKKDVRALVAFGSKTGIALLPNSVTILDAAVGQKGKITEVSGQLSVSIPTANPLGTALAFDGSQQTTVTISPPSGLTNAFTIECWVKPAGLPGAGSQVVIVQNSTSGQAPFTLGIQGACPVFTAGARAVGGPALDLNTWYHVAGVFDGSTPTLYVNGEQYLAATTPATAAGSAFVFGGPSSFTGTLDEVRLWNTNLDQSTIQANMCTSIASPPPMLVGYWPLDEPAGVVSLTTVPNIGSASTGDGVLVGPVWTPSNAPIGVSMPPIAWDTDGLDMEGTLLTTVQPASTPALFAGSDGLVHLYFQNAAGVLSAVHLNSITARANYTTTWLATDDVTTNPQQGVVRFIARQPGSQSNLPRTLPVIAGSGNTCTVTLTSYSGLTETWPNVPMDLASFLAVLNGNAIQATSDPVAVGRNLLMYDYTKVVVTASATQTEPAPAAGSGSGIFNVTVDAMPTNGVAGVVQPTDDNAPVLDLVGLDCAWIADPAPASLSLNQGTQPELVQVLTASDLQQNPSALPVRGSLCIEAWISPTGQLEGQPGTLMCLYHPTANTTAILGLDRSGYLFAGDGRYGTRCGRGPIPPNTWTHVALNHKSDFGIRLSNEDASNTRYLHGGGLGKAGRKRSSADGHFEGRRRQGELVVVHRTRQPASVHRASGSRDEHTRERGDGHDSSGRRHLVSPGGRVRRRLTEAGRACTDESRRVRADSRARDRAERRTHG